MNRIFHNYHSHTIHCNHAEQSIEDVIISAIESGYKTVGFSEHLYYPDTNRNYRLRTREDFESYISTVNKMKEKYSKKIKVLCALECEWIPEYKSWIDEISKRDDIDYLVLGHHGDNLDENFGFMDFSNDYNLMERYTNGMIDAIKSGYFLFIAHPDLPYKGSREIPKTFLKLFRKIIIEAKSNNIPLGFNGNGFSRRQSGLLHYYPYPDFWKIVAEEKAPTLIELDAHEVALWSVEFSKQLVSEAKKYNLHIIWELNI
ncbi:MAG: histidinol-phosphatase [Mycoplasma sp.]|nr:histidinol-phosphatase [Mycoplasma sp.]